MKLVTEQCSLDRRKYHFQKSIINGWNKLSTDCVTFRLNAEELICLKTKLTNISEGLDNFFL